jgi:hypothetical protein
MTRQKLQRVAMEWAVTLTSMKVPDELRSVPTRESHDSLGDLRFRALMSDEEWGSLPVPIRRRFSKRLADGHTVVYTGEVVAMHMSRAGWWLAQLARLIGGPLPTATDTHIPSVVTVTEDMTTGGQIWTRLYARRNGFPQVIHSSKRFAGSTGIEEYLGRGFGMALTIHANRGALVFRSNSYFFQVFGRRFTLPAWLEPGALTVTHAEMGDGRFDFTLELNHPRSGVLIRQSAAFRETTT